MSRRLLTPVVLAFMLAAALPALAASTVYSSAIEDLPLMPGLSEKPDETVVFDNPGGRIVEMNAASDVAPADIRRFYAEALPPLGWTPSSTGTFVRDNERLKIDIDSKDGATAVHFTLTPAAGN